jgi:hypothetical protein
MFALCLLCGPVTAVNQDYSGGVWKSAGSFTPPGTLGLVNGVPSVALNDGNHLPLVNLGGGYNNSETVQSIVEAVQAGFRGIDTALTYLDEEGVGDGIKAVAKTGTPRSELFITTKVPGCTVQLTCGIDNHLSTWSLPSSVVPC